MHVSPYQRFCDHQRQQGYPIVIKNDKGVLIVTKSSRGITTVIGNSIVVNK